MGGGGSVAVGAGVGTGVLLAPEVRVAVPLGLGVANMIGLHVAQAVGVDVAEPAGVRVCRAKGEGVLPGPSECPWANNFVELAAEWCVLEKEVPPPPPPEPFVPEPGTMLLLGSKVMGLAGYAGLRLRKK